MKDNLTIARMSVHAVEQELNKRDAEIERLRGLLREWVESSCQPIAVDILRRTQEALRHD